MTSLAGVLAALVAAVVGLVGSMAAARRGGARREREGQDRAQLEADRNTRRRIENAEARTGSDPALLRDWLRTRAGTGQDTNETALCNGLAAPAAAHAAPLADDGGDRSVVAGARLIRALDAGCGRYP